MLPRLNFPRLILLLLLALPGLAQAAEFVPTRPVRIILPLAPGGTGDVLARIMAQALTGLWPQQALVEARPGAGGHLGAELVARAPGDGHTLLLGTLGIHAAYGMYRRLGYDPSRDLVAAMLVADLPYVVITHPAVPVRSLAELVARARARPGEITFGSAGNGTSTHMGGELFMLATGVRLTHVPYRGSSQALNDLMAGNIDAMFENLPTVPPAARDGRVRPLAVTTEARVAALPDVPTTAEAGVEGFIASAWFALSTAGSTPPALLEAINADMRTALATPAVQARLVQLGCTPMGGTVTEARRFVAAETIKWNRVIAAAGLSVE
jgi:tripartite-type tricarboxylate transporter receptor subunit TctC